MSEYTDVPLTEDQLERICGGYYVRKDIDGGIEVGPLRYADVFIPSYETSELQEGGDYITNGYRVFCGDTETERVDVNGDDVDPSDVLEGVAETVDEKNDDYGNAYEKVGVLKRVMADEDGPTVIEHDGDEYVRMAETPQNDSLFKENADGIYTRLLDKVLRSYTLILIADEPKVENDSTADAACDLAGYAAMLTSLIEGEQ